MQIKASRLLIIFLFPLYLISCSENKHADHNESKTEVKSEIYYTCPMHPQVNESVPGKCPICGMNLVKIEKEVGVAPVNSESGEEVWHCENFSDVTSMVEERCPIDDTPMVRLQKLDASKIMARVKLKASQVSHFRPAYFSVSRMTMQKKIRLLGIVLESEEKERKIPARIAGRVEKVHIKSTGSHIKEGQPVLDIYSPQLITAGEEYLLARQSFQRNPQEFEELYKQSQERLKLWGVKEFQYERWFKQGKVPHSITLYSPASGIVQKRNAIEGKYFTEGQNFFELSELSSVWVEMDVYEHDSALVNIKQKVNLEFSALPGMELESEIDFINPVLNPRTRTLKVRATVANPQGQLKPGMVADATLVLELEGTPLVVPRSAFIDTGKRKVVWVQVDEHTFQAQEIRTGFESEGYVAVVSGLKEEDKVVIEGNFLLDAQAQLFGGYEDFNQPSDTHQH